MSTHWYTEAELDPGRGRNVSRLAKGAAAAVAVGALALGAKAIADSGSSSSASTSGFQGPPSGSALPDRQAGGMGGPGQPPPGMGSEVTGATLDRLKSAVADRYPGTVERAVKLPDGSYVVHVIKADGQELHVLVGKDFKVTGAQPGGPHGGAPPAGEAAPSEMERS